MEKILEIVTREFEAKGIKVVPVSDRAVVSRWRLENGSIDVFMQVDESGEMVHIVGANFIDVEEKYWDCFYELLNDLNDKYLFSKIILDKKEKQICIETEALITPENCAYICYQLMIRITKVAEEIYPLFMKTIWGGTAFILNGKEENY